MPNSGNRTRVILLKGLCLISGFSGLAWITMLAFILVYQNELNIVKGKVPALTLDYLNGGNYFILVLILLQAGAITGLALMWKHKKSGFYIYSILKALLFFLPAVIIGNAHLNFPGLFLTSTPILLFGILLPVFTNE